MKLAHEVIYTSEIMQQGHLHDEKVVDSVSLHHFLRGHGKSGGGISGERLEVITEGRRCFWCL